MGPCLVGGLTWCCNGFGKDSTLVARTRYWVLWDLLWTLDLIVPFYWCHIGYVEEPLRELSIQFPLREGHSASSES